MTTAPDIEASEKAPTNAGGPGKTKSRQKIAARIAIGIVLIVGIIIALRAWMHARTWAGTDNAFIAAHIQQVSSRIAARVESVPVKDNQLVHAGDLLIKLDERDLLVAVQQSEARLASAKANVTKAEAQQLAAESGAAQAAAQLESSRATAQNSDLELSRTKKLRQSGAVAQQALDTATKDSLSDRAGMVAAEKQLGSLQAGIRYTAAAIESAKAAVNEAESDLEKTKLNLSYASILAKQDGRVTVKTVEPGNYVQPGQSAVVRVDAYPGLELHGHVDSIQAGSGAHFSLLPPENATGNYVKVVQRVPVKIILDLTEKDIPLLGPGMSVEPEIRVRK